jgi:hypothetical protein
MISTADFPDFFSGTYVFLFGNIAVHMAFASRPGWKQAFAAFVWLIFAAQIASVDAAIQEFIISLPTDYSLQQTKSNIE